MKVDFGPVCSKLFQKISTVALLFVADTQKKLHLYQGKQWWGTTSYYIYDREMLQELLHCQVCQFC